MEAVVRDQFGREQEATLRGSDKHFAVYEGLNTIGRSKEAAVNIKSLSVSHHHAVIISKDNTYYIVDLNSCNGTILNSAKLTPFSLYELTNESELTFGDVVVYFTTEKLPIRKNGHQSSFENDLTQNVTQTFYNCDTQVLGESNTGISRTIRKEKTNEFEIHEAPTQVVNVSELHLSSKNNVNSIYKLRNRSSESNIHEDSTEIVNLDEFELSSVSNLKSKTSEEDIHDAATQVVNFNEYRPAPSSRPKKKNIEDVQEAETQLVNLKECETPGTSKLTIGEGYERQVLSSKGPDTTSNIQNIQDDNQRETEGVKVKSSGTEINLNDKGIHDAPTQVVDLRTLDDSPSAQSNVHDTPTQTVNLQELDVPSTSKSSFENNFYEAATQVSDINDYTLIDNDNYEEVHTLPTVDKSSDIHEMETQVVHFHENFSSHTDRKDNTSGHKLELDEDKKRSTPTVQVTKNKEDEINSKSKRKGPEATSSVETTISSDSEVRFVSKTNVGEAIETVNESSNDSVDFLIFDKNSKDKNIDENKLSILPKKLCNLPKSKNSPERISLMLQASDDEETDIEENLRSDDTKASLRNVPKPVVTLNDSDTDIEVENKYIEKRTLRKTLGISSDKTELHKSNSESENLTDKPNIAEKPAKNSESSPLVLKRTKKKSKGLIISSDSETDIEDEHTVIKFDKKLTSDMLTKDSDDSDDDIIRVKRKSVNILSTQEEESDKENVGHHSNQNIDTTIPDTPHRLNDTENLDDTDCIPATQDFNTPVLSSQKFQNVMDFKRSSGEKYNRTNNLDDTDCIPGTEDVLAVTESQKKSDIMKAISNENSNDSSESFKLGLTEMMISQNKNSEGFAGFSKPSTSSASGYDKKVILNDKGKIGGLTMLTQTTSISETKSKDIYLEATQNRLKQPLIRETMNEEFHKNKYLEADDAYLAPTQKLDEINDALMNKMVSDDEDDVSKSFNLHLTDKSDSDVYGVPTQKLILNDIGDGRENDEDVYGQPTQKIIIETGAEGGNDTVNSISAQPTPRLNFKNTPTSCVTSKSLNNTAGEDIYFQPTQKLNIPGSSVVLNKNLNDTTGDDIYLQATQQLPWEDQANIRNENENNAAEDIYLQPTQKMLDTFGDNEVKHKTDNMKDGSIFIAPTEATDIFPGLKAKGSGRKKFNFKKNTLSMDSSLSETLPSVVHVSDDTFERAIEKVTVSDVFDHATEKSTGDVIQEPDETMSQISTFVNKIIKNYKKETHFPENPDACDTNGQEKKGDKEEKINEGNLFDLPTQKLPKVTTDDNTVETMSQIAAFVNSTSVPEVKAAKNKKSKFVHTSNLEQRPKASNVRTRTSKAAQKNVKEDPKTSNKTEGVVADTSEEMQIKEAQREANDIPTTASKRSSAEQELPRSISSSSSRRSVSPETKKKDSRTGRCKQVKDESLLPAVGEEAAQSNVREALLKTTIVLSEQKTTARSIGKLRSASVASEEDVEVTTVSDEPATSVRSTRKKRSASVAPEKNVEVTTVSNEPRTSARFTTKKCPVSASEEGMDITSMPNQSETPARSSRKRYSATIAEEENEDITIVSSRSRTPATSTMEKFTSEEKGTTKVVCSELRTEARSISNKRSAPLTLEENRNLSVVCNETGTSARSTKTCLALVASENNVEISTESEPKTSARSTRKKRFSSVTSEKDVEATAVSHERGISARSTRKKPSASETLEDVEITKMSNEPETSARSARKKCSASIASEKDLETTALPGESETPARCMRKKYSAPIAEEENEEMISIHSRIPANKSDLITESARSARKRRCLSFTSEEGKTTNIQASNQGDHRNKEIPFVNMKEPEASTSKIQDSKDKEVPFVNIKEPPPQQRARATRKRKTSVSTEETTAPDKTDLDNEQAKLEVNQSFALLEAKSTRTRKTKKNQEDNIEVKVPKGIKTQKEVNVPVASTSRVSSHIKKQKSEVELSSSSISTCSTPKKQRLTTNEMFVSPERSKRKQRPKVVFTMLENPHLESLIRQLGGSIVDSVESCTVLVTQAVKRSQKLLQAVGQSKPICSPKWIEDSKKAHEFLDPWDYILIDKEAEEKWKFSLKESLSRSRCKKLLQDHTFQLIITKAADVLKGAIEACGGKCVSRYPGKGTTNFYIISTSEDKAKCVRILKQHPEITVLHPEAIFDGVLRQQLKFDDHIVTL